MKKIDVSTVCLPLLTMLALCCGCSNDDNAGPTYHPEIKITSVEPTDTSVDFTYETSDAEKAAFMIHYPGQEVRTSASEILKAGTKLYLDRNRHYDIRKDLQPNTDYVIIAAAGKGNSVSEITKQTFKTNPATIKHTFLSAIGGYEGRSAENGTASYVINFSTNAFSADGSTEHFPTSHLYVALTGDANDVNLKKLAIPTGTYSLGDSNAPAAGKFYAGEEKDGQPFNTFLATQSEKGSEVETNLVKDGTMTIAPAQEAGKYKVEIHFVSENGGKIEGTYEGTITVDNDSGELPPSDELPLPESPLDKDLTLNVTEAYYSNFGDKRYGYKGRNEIYLQLYVDNANYSEYLDLYLLVDKTRFSGEKALPAGKYPLYKWDAFTTPELSAIAGFHVSTTSATDIWLGCNYTYNYSTHVALVSGEVEIVSYDETTKEANLKFTLQDNAATPHTITGLYKGKLQ